LLVFIDIGENIGQLCLNFLFIVFFQEQLVLSQQKQCIAYHFIYCFCFCFSYLFCFVTEDLVIRMDLA